MVEGKIPMAARRHVTNKLRSAYAKASKMDRGRILDEVMATTGMGRSTARRALTGPVLPGPAEQVDKRRLRPKGYGDHYPRPTQETLAVQITDEVAEPVAAVDGLAPAGQSNGRKARDVAPRAPRTQRTRKTGQNRHPREARGHLGGFPESLGQSSTRCFQ